MSTSIFTFDHGQKKLHNAIGIKEEYLEELASKLTEIVKSLKLNMETKEVIDCSPSQIVQLIAEELSYSQLVLVTSFYIREKIEEIEEKTMKSAVVKKILKDDMPTELLAALESFEGTSMSAEDLPPEIRNELLKFIEKLEREKGEESEED